MNKFEKVIEKQLSQYEEFRQEYPDLENSQIFIMAFGQTAFNQLLVGVQKTPWNEKFLTEEDEKNERYGYHLVERKKRIH